MKEVLLWDWDHPERFKRTLVITSYLTVISPYCPKILSILNLFNLRSLFGNSWLKKMPWLLNRDKNWQSSRLNHIASEWRSTLWTRKSKKKFPRTFSFSLKFSNFRNSCFRNNLTSKIASKIKWSYLSPNPKQVVVGINLSLRECNQLTNSTAIKPSIVLALKNNCSNNRTDSLKRDYWDRVFHRWR